MNRRTATFLIVVLTASASAAGWYQLSVPDIEGAQNSLYRGFDELERMGAYVSAEDGTSLGKISRGYASDALGNSAGAGSTYKSEGVFNTYGKYGSAYSTTSAFCDTATKPPQILVQRGNDTYVIGLLTTNRYATTRGQRINPHLLKAWLQSK